MKVSVIIPCFNAADKIGRCISSLRAIELCADEYEVLFVDDCSTDGTYDLILEACKDRPNWRSLRLKSNSGSPSRPRNIGIDAAKGKYIYFLDCDDEILPPAIKKLLALAEQTNACVVRSELLSNNGREHKLMNQIAGWNDRLTAAQRRELIINKTSTVINSFVRRSLLLEHNIRWPEQLRMGEDTVFLAEVLIRAERIEYLPEPTYIYNKLPSLTPASTQRYGRKELLDHLQVWSTVQNLLSVAGIDYYRGRLPVGLRVALESLIYRNKGDIDEPSFERFHEFISSNWGVINSFSYVPRLKDLLKAINKGDYSLFRSLCRPRLLIAGHDLKFIRDAIPELDAYFDIRVDEWRGHAIHDEQRSRELLAWAEYIWCEWLLKNAEWYATNKRDDQRLVVRMHRMELERNHGEALDVNKVDAVVAVSPLFFERLFERFPNIPRYKARLIPNYVRVNQYEAEWHPDRLYTLAMIGIVPSRKGYHRALRILHALRLKDQRFRLEIFGRRPEELSWIARDPNQMEYFQRCEKYIELQGLKDAIYFNGHVDVTHALSKRRVGYVLSLSDSDYGLPGFESFHLAVADGFAAQAVSVIRRWPGAEYLWPKRFLIDSEEEAVECILKYSQDPELFRSAALEGRSFVESRYSIDRFIEAIVSTYREFS